MRALSLLLVALFLSYLVACGGSSYSAPQNPVFTSTPVTAASQGASYIYGLAATDPSGGTVTFSLTTAPAGAALSGATITWGPTATESRVSNSFVAKATTSSGGSATQSWTVTPTGTVTVNWFDTDWTPAGPVQVPQAYGPRSIGAGSTTRWLARTFVRHVGFARRLHHCAGAWRILLAHRRYWAGFHDSTDGLLDQQQHF
jgi:hypothetical protein